MPRSRAGLTRRIVAGGPPLLLFAVAWVLLGVLVWLGLSPWPSLIVLPAMWVLGGLLSARVRRRPFEHSEGHVLCAVRPLGDEGRRHWEHGFLIPDGATLGFHPRGSGLTQRAARYWFRGPLPPADQTRALSWTEQWSVDGDLRVASWTSVDGRGIEVAAHPQDMQRLEQEYQ